MVTNRGTTRILITVVVTIIFLFAFVQDTKGAPRGDGSSGTEWQELMYARNVCPTVYRGGGDGLGGQDGGGEGGENKRSEIILMVGGLITVGFVGYLLGYCGYLLLSTGQGGICYEFDDTAEDQPKSIEKISSYINPTH